MALVFTHHLSAIALIYQKFTLHFLENVGSVPLLHKLIPLTTLFRLKNNIVMTVVVLAILGEQLGLSMPS